MTTCGDRWLRSARARRSQRSAGGAATRLRETKDCGGHLPAARRGASTELSRWRWSGKTAPRWPLRSVPPLGGALSLGAETVERPGEPQDTLGMDD